MMLTSLQGDLAKAGHSEKPPPSFNSDLAG